MTEIEDADENELSLLYTDLETLTGPQERELRNRALLRDMPLKIEETARQFFPSQYLGFSARSIEVYPLAVRANQAVILDQDRDTSAAYLELCDYRSKSLSFGRFAPAILQGTTFKCRVKALFQRKIANHRWPNTSLCR